MENVVVRLFLKSRIRVQRVLPTGRSASAKCRFNPLLNVPARPFLAMVSSMTASKNGGNAESPAYGQRAALWIAGWTVFRLWFCTTFELAGDEAYYWLWSKRLDMSYFSKGPGVAWTIALGTRLFGDTVLGVRFFSVLLSAGTGAALYFLGCRLFSARIGFWTVVVASFVPLLLVGSVLMTIDPLSVFFWMLTANVFWKAKDTDRLPFWGLAGVFVGLGALCKYTNLAQIPAFAFFCACSREHRHHLLRPTFWCMTLVALVCLTPVVLWNLQHQGVTWAHLIERGALDRPWRLAPAEFLEFLAGQALVVFPLFFIGMLASLFAHDIREVWPAQVRYLEALFWPLFGFYAVLALNRAGPPNWTAPSLVCGLVLMTADWTLRTAQSHWAARVAATTLVLAALTAAIILILSFLPLPMKRDPFVRVRGSRDLAVQVAEFCDRHGAEFVIAQNYQDASLLSFYLPGHPTVFMPNTRQIRSQFALWPGYGRAYRGRNAVYVAKHRPELPQSLRAEFESIEPAVEVESRFRGQPVRKYYLYLCRSFLGVQDAQVNTSAKHAH